MNDLYIVDVQMNNPNFLIKFKIYILKESKTNFLIKIAVAFSKS